MLSDEEKEAIEWLKRLVKLNKRDNLDDTFAEILLNLIEKQSKEIESLKEDNKKKSIVIIEYQDLYEKLEDKIKAKIEDLKENSNGDDFNLTNVIMLFKSLLEKE